MADQPKILELSHKAFGTIFYDLPLEIRQHILDDVVSALAAQPSQGARVYARAPDSDALAIFLFSTLNLTTSLNEHMRRALHREITVQEVSASLAGRLRAEVSHSTLLPRFQAACKAPPVETRLTDVKKFLADPKYFCNWLSECGEEWHKQFDLCRHPQRKEPNLKNWSFHIFDMADFHAKNKGRHARQVIAIMRAAQGLIGG